MPRRPAKTRSSVAKAAENATNVGSGILELVSRYGTVMGVAFIAYLQTMFPSKESFMELEKKIDGLEKQLTEIVIIQNAVQRNGTKIDNIEDRIRQMELELAKQKNNN
tara:strand:+ start:691 stop:1014 length:324 start_codon:yes stop_codon:yes gene_type:complete